MRSRSGVTVVLTVALVIQCLTLLALAAQRTSLVLDCQQQIAARLAQAVRHRVRAGGVDCIVTTENNEMTLVLSTFPALVAAVGVGLTMALTAYVLWTTARKA